MSTMGGGIPPTTDSCTKLKWGPKTKTGGLHGNIRNCIAPLLTHTFVTAKLNSSLEDVQTGMLPYFEPTRRNM